MYHLSIGIWECCKAGGVINIGWCSDTGKWDGGRHVSDVWSVQNGCEWGKNAYYLTSTPYRKVY